jgi:4-hydroxybenzoate polyprenyltransferase
MAHVVVEARDEARVRSAPAVRRSSLRALVVAARPLQWTKNLLVFAGIVFAVELDDVGRWISALLLFASFCLASSACYLVNDVHDADEDRRHPVKRDRPIASGELAPRHALVAAGVLAAAAIALAVPTTWGGVVLVLTFLAFQGAYTLGLKDVVLLDALVIAWLFVIRAAAGAVGLDVRLSPWLVLCTGLLALFLALGKRRGELVLVGAELTPGRPVLQGYSLELVDQLVSIVAAATISAYSIYTFTATDSEAMMLTIPFVIFGLFRYLYLVHKHDLGEEPDRVAVTDKPILITVALWVLTAAVILSVS